MTNVLLSTAIQLCRQVLYVQQQLTPPCHIA